MKDCFLNILLLLCLFVKGQDLHFTQYEETPALINPALTGVSSWMRASVIFKEQWRNVSIPYRTYGASFEMRIKPGGWQQVDEFRSMTFKEKSMGRLAAGVSVFSDNAGDGALHTDVINLSLATFVPLSKKSHLSLGLQGSMIQKKVDQNKLLFSNQYNGSVYDPSLSSNEKYLNTNFIYYDIASGFLWSVNDKSDPAKKFQSNLGVSFYHMTFSGTEQDIFRKPSYLKYVFYGNLSASLRDPSLLLSPSFLFQEFGPSSELVMGISIKKMMNSNSKYTGIVKGNGIGVGLYYRNKDAVAVRGIFEYREQFMTSISYDINISTLSSASAGKGGIEISIVYIAPKPFLYQKR